MARCHCPARETGWDKLHARFLTKRINHSESYSDGEACTNQAESFFSRLRRAEMGVHHRISGAYLGFYAGEMAWREDHRRKSNGVQYLMATNAALIPIGADDNSSPMAPATAGRRASAGRREADHRSASMPIGITHPISRQWKGYWQRRAATA